MENFIPVMHIETSKAFGMFKILECFLEFFGGQELYGSNQAWQLLQELFPTYVSCSIYKNATKCSTLVKSWAKGKLLVAKRGLILA